MIKKCKRILRLFLFICLILLASIGIGICGGVPIPISFKRDKTVENIELIETREESSDSDSEEAQK